ncbi:Pcl10p [Saccharomyces eubayanus]|uniref:Pcl10p n=1 Tax=Saccharomyces eubayanus TaxID=1080349 RepID=UPI0006C01A87|nr:PCL10-like protein [Saccharomyces eubayanus]KOG99389.1 PCL10-like protein [Saccharomyces eubayanus]
MTTNSGAELEELEDCDARSVSLGIVDDYSIAFELPLKPKFLQSENFSDLASDWEKSMPDTPGPSSSSKPDNMQFEDAADNSTSKNRVHVEQLLRSANEMNNYLAQNMEKINDFQVGLLNGGKGLYSAMGDDSSACLNATNLSSTSNFELSDDELEDTTGCTSSIFDKNLLHQQSGLNITRRKSPLSKPHNPSFEIGDSPDIDKHNVKDFDFSECSSITSFDIGGLHIRPPHGEEEDKLEEDRDEQEESNTESENPLLRGIPSDTELPHISVEEALANFSGTINLILELSKSENCTISNNKETEKEYANFYMKSKPSLSSVDFLKRVQDKCEYESTVYLVATYLMDTIFLTRNGSDVLQLKLKLQEKEIHRMIIATVRLSTKLLEDFVHSHEYFSKVCGVSKRLLSKLEVSLLVCLSDSELMISNKKLVASGRILDELRSSCK